MKKQPKSTILRENSSDKPPLNPNSMKHNRNRKQKANNENTPPPSNINIIPDSPSFTGKPSPSVANKLKSHLPPRPPFSNPLKRKLSNDCNSVNGVSGSSDTGVKVIVRMRPPSKSEGAEVIVQKTAGDSLSILGQDFTFDAVADTVSTQADIFELVGAPLVENCIAGFNSSIFAYGQTGSGKTYTIWGPANALLEENLSCKEQGLTPRVFERLFSRITEEQNRHADKQLNYQCRCSFLEIYNEQITDLLNPSQRNLHLREDTKNGVYVENLTEETICNLNDVTQLLRKGLSNRRTGATSINLESSRSHSVFTCVVESQCKSIDGLSCFKTSRMNLVDLAGSERQKLTGAAGDRLKEAGNINRSLSQLGNLINILAEVSQTGKQRHIPYRDSKLTFLLQESLGGNAKLVMVCAITPAQSCRSETLSTLRFAHRAKAIKNKAVVNEQMQNDVKTLREVIRQLKDELVRMKSTGNQADRSAGQVTGWTPRKSMALLKFSLNRPLILPHDDDDGDEEMEIVDEGEQVPLATPENCNSTTVGITSLVRKDSGDSAMVPSEVSPVLKSPTLSVSPITNSNSRKSLRTSTMLTASQKAHTHTANPEALENSCQKPSNSVSLNAQSARLAASLNCGLEVLNKHQKGHPFGRSSFKFPYKPLDIKPVEVKKDIGVQAFLPGNELGEEGTDLFLCRNCKGVSCTNVKDGDGLGLQLIPVDGCQLADQNKQLVPKAVEKVLAGAIRREMALEELCARQDSKIKQLNHLLQQYKHERECNLIIGQIREDKIARLESLMDGILSVEDFKEDELASLKTENKIMKEMCENHTEVLRTEIEVKRIQDELERYQNFFDLGERDVLLEEIQDLRIQLQYYTNSSSNKSKKSSAPLQITYPSESADQRSESADQRFELERKRWNEAERKWISLVEDLERELNASRLLVEKQRNELHTEKVCSKELKEAMQMAMEGHARMLEQYANLEEKHINLLASQRRIDDGIIDIKNAAAQAGVKNVESKFINALATEISTLKVEKENERRRYRDEINGLQAQLKDTEEAVQAAGEVLVTLKEAEEAVAAAEARARDAEQEKEKACKQIEKLKHKQLVDDMPKYGETNNTKDRLWRDEFDKSDIEDERDLTKLPEPSSWFSGHDKCNI
ncbi:kinesin-like protein KIN-12B isoform X2 [Rutidosis leptorrhynchoides]|uniref:kinesin-like protein KIN-12B isoform X2 n=1 Tax=Rutidosis leptorrhynchoides TaxID=125765 RepID=UPI003A98FF39